MINLLPPEEKEGLRLQQVKKLVAILGSAVVVIIICLILILFSINYYILGEIISQKFSLEQAENRYKTSDFLKYKNILQNYNKGAAQLKSFYKEGMGISSALENILAVEKPVGIYFSNLSINMRENNDKIIVNISGASDTRDSLLVFKKNLEGKGEIKNINFSPESWINPSNINFYLTFEVY